MARPADPQPPDDIEAATPVAAPASARRGAAASTVSLLDLPVAGMTRRRIALLLGALVAAWVIVLFAHQVGQASEASARAEAMRASNASLTANVAALQAELDLIQRQAYVDAAGAHLPAWRPPRDRVHARRRCTVAGARCARQRERAPRGRRRAVRAR